MSAAAAPVTTTAITPTVLVETSRALPLVSLAVSLRTGAIEDPDPPHLQKTPIDLERESGEQDR